MIRRAAVLLLLAACAGESVPIERIRIGWVGSDRHGSHEKGGVAIDGWTCGENYARAVSGNAEAEALIARCEQDNHWYAALLSTFVIAPFAAVGLDHFIVGGRARDIVFGSGLGIATAAFVVGVVMGHSAAAELRDAVHLYNAQLARDAR